MRHARGVSFDRGRPCADESLQRSVPHPRRLRERCGARLAVVQSMRRVVPTFLFVAAALLRPTPAGAGLLASESFGYPQGTLNGQSGGTGWTGAWLTGQPGVFVVQASSLTSGAGGTGGSLFFDGSKAVSGTGARVFRALATDPGSAAWAAGVVESTQTRFGGKQLAFGKPSTTVWFGAAVNGGTAGNGVAGVQYLSQFHFYSGPTTTPAALALG